MREVPAKDRQTIALALSVRQPWAVLLCRGIKNVENRGKVPPRYVESGTWIAIHASGTIAPMVAWESVADDLGVEPGDVRRIRNETPRSAIVGAVKYVRCLRPDDRNDRTEERRCQWPWWEPRSYDGHGHGWIFDQALELAQPIMNVGGKLGVWRLSDDLAKRVAAAMPR